MAEVNIYYNLVAMLMVVGAAVGITTLYWRRRYETLCRNETARLSSEMFRADVALESAVKTAKNNHDVMRHVLAEVQALQESVDSLLILMNTNDIKPGQKMWDTACRVIRQKNTLLADVVTVTFEMMYYENQRHIQKNDEIVVNKFCHDVFESCLPMMPEGVETRMETAVPDDCMIRTDIETLKRMIRNLLLNSMSNTSEGIITLKVGEDTTKGVMVFAVSDTAPCIPTEFREKIFKRLPNIDIHKLLLTLRVRTSKLMARHLGGTLYIDSYVGSGNTVVFTVAKK